MTKSFSIKLQHFGFTVPYLPGFISYPPTFFADSCFIIYYYRVFSIAPSPTFIYHPPCPLFLLPLAWPKCTWSIRVWTRIYFWQTNIIAHCAEFGAIFIIPTHPYIPVHHSHDPNPLLPGSSHSIKTTAPIFLNRLLHF